MHTKVRHQEPHFDARSWQKKLLLTVEKAH